MREHLESFERQTGRLHPVLADAPVLPDGLGPLWRDFMAMHSTRSSTGFSPMRISYADLEAYQRVEGVRLAPWQVEAIKRADAAYLDHHAKTRKAN